MSAVDSRSTVSDLAVDLLLIGATTKAIGKDVNTEILVQVKSRKYGKISERLWLSAHPCVKNLPAPLATSKADAIWLR